MATIRELVTRWGFDVDMSGLEKMEARTEKLRAGFLKVGAVATAALAGLVVPAAALDESLRKALSAAGKLGPEFDAAYNKMSKKAMDLSEQLGISASDIATGFYDVISAGLDPMSQGFDDFAEVGLKLAKITGGDVGAAVDRLGTTLTAFSMDTSEAITVADKFVKGNVLGRTSIEELAASMRIAGSTASKVAGADLNQTIAALVGLADAGFKAENGGEALKQVLLSLTAPVPRAAKMLERLGIETVDKSTGKFRDFSDIIAQFERQTAGLSESQRAFALEQIFGRETVNKFVSVMAVGSEKLRYYEQELKKSDGSLEQTIRDLEGFLDVGRKVWAAVKNLAATFGAPLIKPLTNVGKIFLFLTSNARKWLEARPGFTDMASKLVGVGLAATVLASGLAIATTSLKLARIAIKKIGTEAVIAQAKAFALPFLFVAIGTVLFLLFDDIAAAIAGNNSLLGDLIKKYSEWSGTIKVLVAGLVVLAVALGIAFFPVTLLIVLLAVLAATILRNLDAYKEFWEYLKAHSLGEIWKDLKGWVAEWTGLADAMERVKRVWDDIRSGRAPAQAGRQRDVANEQAYMGVGARGEYFRRFGSIPTDDELERYLRDRAGRNQGPPTSAPIPAPPTVAPLPGVVGGRPGGTATTAPQVNVGGVTVNGVGLNREQVIGEIRDAQGRQLQDAAAQLE
jgi:TP901 family phage tail tape measure protein